MEYIYGLIESGKPVSQIKYIGRTNNPAYRLKQHRKGDGTKKGKWIEDLRSKGETVNMVILDSSHNEDVIAVMEKGWVAFARSVGWDIENTITYRTSKKTYSVTVSDLAVANLHIDTQKKMYEELLEARLVEILSLTREKLDLTFNCETLKREITRKDDEIASLKSLNEHTTQRMLATSERLDRMTMQLKDIEDRPVQRTIESLTGFDIDKLISAFWMIIIAIFLAGASEYTGNVFLFASAAGAFIGAAVLWVPIIFQVIKTWVTLLKNVFVT